MAKSTENMEAGCCTFETVLISYLHGKQLIIFNRADAAVKLLTLRCFLCFLPPSGFRIELATCLRGIVYPSISYFVQQLFRVNQCIQYLPSTLPTPSGTWYLRYKCQDNIYEGGITAETRLIVVICWPTFISKTQSP
ncbi:hypothetical protein BU15DRAFT_62013 [Melanogaster broomeanus]|nr:hypothetical protein BU15DRAFT_62013 [Melanogaster broomeanus]